MKTVVLVAQIIFSVIIVILIVLQSRGTGFARSSGGSSSSFTRRGLEKFVFKLTFIISALFIVVSIVSYLV